MLKNQETPFRMRNSLIGIRHSSLRFGLGCSVMWAVMLPWMLISSAAAQINLNDVPGFTVLVASARRTDIVVDGQPEVTTETSESIQIQYRVRDFRRSGDVHVDAIVRIMDRQPPTSVLTRLTGATFSLVIHRDGNVSMLNSEGRDELVTHLANGDPESEQVLKKCLTDESIASWFSVPFWMIRPEKDENKTNAWERRHDVSLGTLGSLKLDLNFRLGDIEDRMAKVAIASDARFRPLVLPDTAVASFPYLLNASVEIDEVSGTGLLHVASPDADEPPGTRPEFESVEWTLRLHGNAQLPLAKLGKTAAATLPDDANTAEQDGSRRTGTVTFRQTQKQTWTLQSFLIGRPGMTEYDRLTVPVPLQ